jgi:chromosome segregation ATPase
LITAIQERVVALEGGSNASGKIVKDLSGEVARLSVLVSRVDRFDDALAEHRIEINRFIDDLEKKRAKREQQDKKNFRKDIDSVNKDIAQVSEKVKGIDEIKKDLNARQAEDARILSRVDELFKVVDTAKKLVEDNNRAQKLMEDARRQDTKKLTDLLGETTAYRKRSDELTTRMDMILEGQRKTDVRVSELMAAESARREDQTAFTENLSLAESERERIWKDWSKRFDVIEKQSQELSQSMNELETAQRAVNEAQTRFEDMSEQLERRINELTEMQRLTEERFRQDWMSFKADDQKRWTNYALSQEEQIRESNRKLEKIEDRITVLDDQLQELQDIIQHLNNQIDKRLQTFLTTIRDWVNENERFFGKSR